MEERIEDSNYEYVRELAIHCKKEWINLADLMSALRIKNILLSKGVIKASDLR